MIPIYVGFDQREACVFHVFNQSVIENASVPVSLIPLEGGLLNFDGQRDGTNGFIFSRYLVPFLQNYEGWAIFADGDMHVNADIKDLWDLRDESKAVMVVKHDYKTHSKRKYVGSPIENDNIDYPRKNWSSVILFNCGHPSNKFLTPDYIAEAEPRMVHRFDWLNDDEIGELPVEWNHLCGEYRWNPNAKLVHQTLGTPGFSNYRDCDSAEQWSGYLRNALEIIGEDPIEMVQDSLSEKRSLKIA